MTSVPTDHATPAHASANASSNTFANTYSAQASPDTASDQTTDSSNASGSTFKPTSTQSSSVGATVDTRHSKTLRLLAIVFSLVTFVLVTSGGLVTSYNAGMSVPDWPASFGKWLFLPIQVWSDMAVFLEHNHRLSGMVSGLLCIGVLVMCCRRYGLKGIKGKPSRLALIVLAAFLVQGAFGGFRVNLQTWFGEHGVYQPARLLAIIHGVTGQLVFGAVVVLTAMFGPWAAKQAAISANGGKKLIGFAGKIAVWVFLILLTIQLVLGATIRHNNAASAVPDAPFIYGGFFPPMDQAERAMRFEALGGTQWTVYETEPAADIDAVNRDEKPQLLETTPTTYAQSPTNAMVLTHYAHRVFAMVILPIGLFACLCVLLLSCDSLGGLSLPISALVSLFCLQVVLGMGVIFSKEEPWVASAHQAVGALLMATTAWLVYRTHAARQAVR